MRAHTTTMRDAQAAIDSTLAQMGARDSAKLQGAADLLNVTLSKSTAASTSAIFACDYHFKFGGYCNSSSRLLAGQFGGTNFAVQCIEEC